MKNILIITLFLSNISLGQDKIEGIGKFKIKKYTIDQLDTLVTDNYFMRQTVSNSKSFFNLYNKSDILIEIQPDTVEINMSIAYSLFCKKTRVFFIPKYSVAGIELKNTYLTFYNDTLTELQTDYTFDVINAIKLKYGEAKIDKKEKEISCELKLTGAKVNYTETMYYQYWYNGSIKCTAAIGDYRNSKCEKKTISYITVNNEKNTDQINRCDEKEKQRLKNRLDDSKKRQLSDF